MNSRVHNDTHIGTNGQPHGTAFRQSKHNPELYTHGGPIQCSYAAAKPLANVWSELVALECSIGDAQRFPIGRP